MSWVYLFVYIPTKDRKAAHQQKAFELTKNIGNKKIRCVSLTTNNFEGGKAFYIIEENAESDPTKFCYKIEEGWDKSAHPIKIARRNAEEIIRFLPYSVYYIDDLNMSAQEFFAQRENVKKMRELEDLLKYDIEKMNMYFFPDLMEKELYIIQFTHTAKKTKYSYYILEINVGKEIKKYVCLFFYPKGDDKYAKLRIERYISYYNANNPWNGSISSEVIYAKQELNDFLKTHPFYTHQYAYKNLESISPYYDSDYSK